MPIELPVEPDRHKEWKVTGRFVLVSLILFFVVVAGVNGVMMTAAIRTFPGADVSNGYDVSQGYNREIALAKAQAVRGWVSDIRVSRHEGNGAIKLTLHDKNGALVSGVRIDAQLAHPTNKALDRVVPLLEAVPGSYEALVPQLHEGAWDLHLTGMRDGQRVYVATSRIDLK